MNNQKEYRAYYYKDSQNGKVPVLKYVSELSPKDKAKVAAYIKLLCDHEGRLDEPYSRHICSGIRELRVDFSRNRHRVFYIAVEERRIILLHAFLKNTPKTPKQHVVRAINNFEDYKQNKKLTKYE